MTKITGTNTYIDVELDDRTVRILGEMIVGGFVCYKSSMKNWLIPENEPLTEGDKNEIIQKVTEKTAGSHMVITKDWSHAGGGRFLNGVKKAAGAAAEWRKAWFLRQQKCAQI